MKNKYPVYVISKGRWDQCLTANFLLKDKIDFKIVIEPQEEKLYLQKYPKRILNILPFSNLGLGSIPARNWVWEDSIKNGHERHWILDDNIRSIMRWNHNKRIKCDSSIALKCVEDFTDRYENIAISGLNYHMFAIAHNTVKPPFNLNHHVYSCLLIMNKLNNRWRGRYNEDTDLCLQVLSEGWCTVLINAFLIEKMRTMTMKGGNMDQLYKADGRLKMARSLERVWPHVVETRRRFNRPQHHIKFTWGKFDNQLKLKSNVNLNNINKINEYNSKLVAIKEIKSKKIMEIMNKV